jgi:hypothetical protein
MKTKIGKIVRIPAFLLICLLLFFCKESLKVDQADLAGMKKAVTTAQAKTLPSDDGPGNRWTMNGITRVEVPVTGVQLKSATVTGADNENNNLTGTPDGDVDVYLFRIDPEAPIEFNIFISDLKPINTAKLSLLCWDVDWATTPYPDENERDMVSINGHDLGYLSGANDEWSTSIFDVDPSWINPGTEIITENGSQIVPGKNLVKVDIDTKLTGSWAVRVDWGQLVINGTTSQTAKFRYVTIPKTQYQALETVVISEEVDATPDLSVRVETNLVDPGNNIIAGTSRIFTAIKGDDPFTESLTIPTTSLPGDYNVVAILYDAVTNQQLDIKYVPFKVVSVPECINPTLGGVIGNAQIICAGGDPLALTSVSAASGFTGTLEYKWQFSIDGNSFSDIPLSNMESYDPPAITQTTSFIRLARVDCKADWVGAVGSNPIKITVNPLPKVEAGDPVTIYKGYAGAQLAALGNEAGGDYSWSPSTGLDDAGIAKPVATPVTTTTYTVTFTNANGCKAIDIVTVEVLDPVAVPFDIKPAGCPNPFNRGEKGVLPVAVLGYSGLNVTDIDPGTLRLEGVEPIRWALEDVAAPYLQFVGKKLDKMSCNTTGKDGYMDLTVKFDATRIASLPLLKDKKINNVVALKLTGQLKNGTPIRGEDVIIIVK